MNAPDRVRPLAPLTSQQMTAISIIAGGWSMKEAARMMGVAYGTLRTHLDRATAKIPGNLYGRARLVAWWRGADAEVLGVGFEKPSRQETLKLAYAISVQTPCPTCGTVVHGTRPEARTEGHE